MGQNHRIAAILIAALPWAMGAAEAQDEMMANPLFANQVPLELRIVGPFQQLSRDGRERPERDAIVEILNGDGEPFVLDAEIRIRGNTRVEICDRPPLSIDFSRQQVAGTEFAGQNTLKLVTLCRRTDIYRDYLRYEFLIYRLFNLLRDASFRVRWMEVEYVQDDTGKPRSYLEPAFFIEEEWEVAERLGLDVIKRERLSLDSLDASHTALLMLFQYMIGNTDVAVLRGSPGEDCCHNGKVIGAEGVPLLILPYDFDQSGLINAQYAAPSEQLPTPIRSVTQRLYRGFCQHNAEIDAAISRLNENREMMESLLDDQSVSKRARERALDFLSESFERINEPKRLQSDIIEGCRA